jgi:hypothetical protein
MDEFSLLKKLETVKAPPDFEQKVMAELALRRRSERPRRLALRWSLAGSLAGLLAIFVLLNVFVLRQKAPVVTTETKGGIPASGLIQEAAINQTVPLIETLDYTTEFRSRSREPQAVYLLEQVSDSTPKGITY